MNGPDPDSDLRSSLDRQAHLWLAYPGDPEVQGRFAAYRELLSTPERRRLDRFRVARARDEYLVGRALARTALSRYAAVAPREWRLVPDERGRPAITGPGERSPLTFNLAHSHGLVACLVSLEPETGVDVESTARSVEIELLANRYFSPRERADLLPRSGEARRRTFFRYWTLKEAYLKAVGVGIALPLRKLSFTAPGEEPIGVRFEPPLEDDAAGWRFDLGETASGHLVATAIRRRAGSPLEIVAREVVPLSAIERDPGLRLPLGLG